MFERIGRQYESFVGRFRKALLLAGAFETFDQGDFVSLAVVQHLIHEGPHFLEAGCMGRHPSINCGSSHFFSGLLGCVDLSNIAQKISHRLEKLAA